MNEILTPAKRPLGMTILLVLSLTNAIYQIISALFTFFLMPVLKEMYENGQFEELMEGFMSSLDPTMLETMMDNLAIQLAVNPFYYLIMALLYAGSLVGVLKMFKLQRLGFHIYSISQLLILIAEVAFIYSKMPQSPFFNAFLTTLLFILIYHLFFKRIELMEKTSNDQLQ